MRLGRVYLVGAGPGDPGLLTVRGLELLRRAQVIVFDQLVNPDLLEKASAGAMKIFAGKRAGRHCIAQSEINQALIDHAVLGYEVVRLKGGDPFVFGRGGEEAEALGSRRYSFRDRSRRQLGRGGASLRRHSTHAQKVFFFVRGSYGPRITQARIFSSMGQACGSGGYTGDSHGAYEPSADYHCTA